ncbi:hypothetical protein LV716_15420 [Flagellimonas sp. HMM57]|uniref:hypothetical protein n=1 Tax=unclassified Flagellimonas TaxID=2644544 RepID=UPI0013D05F88|nr:MULTISPECIES: hypothetical protein [unclassified Flagellimonas]UII75633.1 hypothetical protein LV716_15420 [Flagellimonas sp. HMM57]
MIFKNTNIERELHAFREKHQKEHEILEEVQRILQKHTSSKAAIEETLNSKKTTTANNFNFDLLETDRIYHIDQIKQICIDYRLRFLDSRYFKGKIPEKGISKIKELENAHNIEIQGFKIMAPSKLFKLEDKDDPLLFAPIGNGYFYLIHKWGNDLHPMRKLLVWPFKNIVNLASFVFLISYFATLIVPNGLFSKSNSSAEFWIIYFFMFKCIASVVIFYGFALGKNFNPAIWNSKYFNA